MALNHIKNLRKPNLNIINKVLCLNSLIKQEHYDLCVSIIRKRVNLDLPIPHTYKVTKFSKIGGIENLKSLRKSYKFISGCYSIWGTNKPKDFCYIGQAKHLGHRIKIHAKGQNKNTREFCQI